MRAVATPILVLMLATIAVGACSPRPVRTVTIGGERWSVYQGGGDGMRGLPGFGDVDGMLFEPHQDAEQGEAAFTMEGVPYPIDIAWFDATGDLVSVASMAPCMAAPCPLYRAEGPYRWAIEAPPGAFADLGANDRLVVD
jgi:uncharacterized membrane protein (UPF0127 family)